MSRTESMRRAKLGRPTLSTFQFAKKPGPITKFDNTDMGPLSPHCEPRRRDLVQKQTREPSHILMTALLEHLCQVYARDDYKASALFQMICQRLSQLDFINPLIFQDEMSGIRNQYRNIVHHMLRTGMSRLSKHSPSITYSKEDRLQVMSLPTEITWNVDGMLSMKTSRYETEFMEIECIGKGGFGAVYKARNKLEGREYAVKKIRFVHRKSEVIMKMLREVKALANLRHVNIIGYNAAWMEYDPPFIRARSAPTPLDMHDMTSSHSQSTGSSSSNDVHVDGPSNSASITFEGSSSLEGPKQQQEGKAEKVLESLPAGAEASEDKPASTEEAKFSSEDELQKPKSSSSSPAIHRQSSAHSFLHTEQMEGLDCNVITQRLATHDDSSFIEFLDCPRNSKPPSFKRSFSHDPKKHGERPLRNSRRSSGQSYVIQSPVTLYIQMELCHGTLQGWMKERNSRPRDTPICPRELESASMRIFEQVLQGVEYIHSQGIIHRDLKPRNIFLMEPDLHVKIGDFGLATEDILLSDGKVTILSPSPHEIKDAFLFEKLTSGVGTTQYAAPEQLEGSLYNSQSDVFSLGIVLYELFHYYGTEMERVESLTDLRNGIMSEEFVKQWPAQAEAVRKMTRIQPQDRPAISQLLLSNLFTSKENIISRLEQQLQDRDAEIALQNQELDQLRTLLTDRERTVMEQNSKILALTSELAELKLRLLR